ncbi:DUF523 and DUF1722 domain-containing protein [Clostridium sp. D53t1_180928_C8]|uniref:YbgA family protein n=1 Tax=Clostridium sp. D53t1_180928_C8 TaxID=2787101 RepID=UPI0018A89022|nr:DUF523 and DUF1722 domain-containing protein [Clostridium sp. D53t1_180928_C8]
MLNTDKPIIVISKCLGFESCKYNGNIEENEFIDKLKKYVEVIPICPEVECGLSTPRNPVRIVEIDNKKELIQPNENRYITNDMINFSKKFINKLEFVDGFIFKCKSPSCGVKDAKVYTTIEKGRAIRRDKGIFAEAVMQHFPYIPIEDDGRLTNFKIREHFLARIFILCDFRISKNTLNFESLRKFHLKNSLLFLSYSQKYSRALDDLIYKDNIENLETLFKEYEFYLHRLLEKAPRYTSNINVLLKSLDQFNDKITSDEMQFIWSTIDKYKNGYVPFSVPLYLVKSYIIRFDLNHLVDQTFFMPYPEDLVLVNDSGKLIH